MKIDEFTLEQTFHKIVREEDGFVTYWREVKEPGEGYIVFWLDGESHHTYHYPPEIWG